MSTTVFATFLTVSYIAICKILVGSVMVHVANNMLMMQLLATLVL